MAGEIKDDYEIDLSKQKATYEIKVGVSYIEIPYFDDADRKRIVTREHDPLKTPVTEVEYNDKWYEVIGGKRDKDKKPTHYWIKVTKKEFPKALPKSTGYFILPKELEAIYGIRASEIVVIVFANTVSGILPGNYVNFNSGGLKCIGDGETANRFNPVTQKWDMNLKICQCAFSASYEKDKEEPVATSVPIDEHLVQRKYKTWDNKNKHEVLVQNAWRDVAFYDEKNKVVQLKPFYRNIPPCQMRSNLRFMVPELGVDLCELSFNKKEYRREVKTQIAMLIGLLSTYGLQIAGIPLILKVEMVTKASLGSPKKIFPKITLRLKDSIRELVEKYGTKQLGNEAPQSTLQLDNGDNDIEFVDDIENAEIVVDDIVAEDTEYNQAWDNMKEEVKPSEEEQKMTNEAVNQHTSEEFNDTASEDAENEIDALKQMIDGKKGEGEADKILKGYIATGISMEERNKNLIKFLKSKL